MILLEKWGHSIRFVGMLLKSMIIWPSPMFGNFVEIFKCLLKFLKTGNRQGIEQKNCFDAVDRCWIFCAHKVWIDSKVDVIT